MSELIAGWGWGREKDKWMLITWMDGWMDGLTGGQAVGRVGGLNTVLNKGIKLRACVGDQIKIIVGWVNGQLD